MLNQTRTEFDVVIVGGGVAGLSTALWCDELGLAALLVEETPQLGGQLLWVYNEIRNYLGREAKNGRELRDAFLAQIEKRVFDLRLAARVSEIDPAKKQIVIDAGARFSARAIVIATGIRRRALGVPGEAEFRGRGIIESGKKEAAALAGKRVLVVGGGDAAFENALILAETAAEVTLVHRRKTFRAREEFSAPARRHPKITILTETAVEEVAGGARLESVRLKSLAGGETRVLPVDALLLRIGVQPNTELLRGKLKLDRNGYIDVDRNCETSAKGVFAVGDAANPLSPTVSTAAGTGATAAKAIFYLLNP